MAVIKISPHWKQVNVNPRPMPVRYAVFMHGLGLEDFFVNQKTAKHSSIPSKECPDPFILIDPSTGFGQVLINGNVIVWHPNGMKQVYADKKAFDLAWEIVGEIQDIAPGAVAEDGKAASPIIKLNS
jgi:hypothetical protein